MTFTTRRVMGSALALSTVAATLIIGGAMTASATERDRVSYCHATHSEKNPYVLITTDKAAVLRAHAMHQDEEDVIPAFSYTWRGEDGMFPGQAPMGGNPLMFVMNGCSMGEGG